MPRAHLKISTLPALECVRGADMCEWHKAISMHKIEIRNTKKGAEGMRKEI